MTARRCAMPVLVLLAWASPAYAHLMNTGMGPFYDGLAHVALTPEDLLPIGALAMLAGLRGAGAGRAVLLALPLSWLAGSLAGLLIPPSVTSGAASAAVTIVLGVLVALDGRLPPRLVAGAAIGVGLFLGWLYGADMVRSGTGSLAVLGSACALSLVVSLLAGQVVSLRSAWARVTVRVAGSWIAACGMLMLGWSMRPG